MRPSKRRRDRHYLHDDRPRSRSSATSRNRSTKKKRLHSCAKTEQDNSEAERDTDEAARSGGGRRSTTIPFPYQSTEIIKSPVDMRKHLSVTLENGLHCTLMSTWQCESSIDSSLPLEPNTCNFQEVYMFNSSFLNMYNKSTDRYEDPDQLSMLGKIAFFPWKESADSVCESKLKDKKNKNDSLLESTRNKKGKGPSQSCPCPEPVDTFGISLTVTVGCVHDPLPVSGLAHLIEHCVFLGSRKFKQPWTVLSNNTYLANAATEMDHTFYFANMDTLAEFLRVVQVFSDMISSPNLDPEFIENEVHSIDSENCIKLSRDFLRIGALFLACAYPEHHMHRFGMGDIKSLGREDISTLVREHFNRYYRPNFMNLCLQAPLPLDELILLAEQSFGSLQATRKPSPWDEVACQGFPFDNKRLCRLYRVYPFKNVQWMILSWVMNPSVWLNHETKPLDYVSLLLSARGKSGLQNYVKRKGWATCCAPSVSSESQEQDACFVTNRFYSGIHFGLELTDEGLAHEVDVVAAVLSYIALLRRVGPKKRIFNELRTVRAHRYHYRTCLEKSCIDFGLSACKPRSPIYTLTAPELLNTYDPQAIRYVLDQLLPSRMNVIIVSRAFGEVTTTIDPVSLVRYSSAPLSQDLLQKLQKIQPYNEFSMPARNPYVSDNICHNLHSEGIGRMAVESCLASLRNSRKATIEYQHRLSPRGMMAYSVFTFEFTSPYCRANPHNWTMMLLWKQILKDRIQDRIHFALQADAAFSVSDGDSGLLLALEGPSAWLPSMWLEVLDEFINFEQSLTEAKFWSFKELHLKILENGHLRYDTLGYSEDLLLYLTTNQYILMSVLAEYLRETVTLKEFLLFTKRFKSRMWIYAQLVGAIGHSELELIARSIADLSYEPSSEDDICMNHIQEMPKGERCLRVRAIADCCLTATTWNYYQIGRLSQEEQNILPVLAKHLSNFMFWQIRTIEQLSYYVKVEADVSFTVASLSVTVIAQADRFKSGYVDERIDTAFVSFYEAHLRSDESIRVLFEKSKLPNNNSDLADSIRSYMASEDFPQRVQALYQTNFPHRREQLTSLDIPGYRKLSVQVQGSPRYEESRPLEPQFLERKRSLYERGERLFVGSGDVQGTQGNVVLELPEDLQYENAYFITNLHKFKCSLNLYPSWVD